MKRTFTMILAALAAAALFAVLVHAVLLTAHLSQPAATTVQGLTPRRLWATAVDLLGLAAVILGTWSLRRPVGLGRKKAITALVAGLIASINGVLNLALATGGPGTGNGVIGGAAACVLGLIAMALGALALVRSRRVGRAN